jgi:hypothetical protein
MNGGTSLRDEALSKTFALSSMHRTCRPRPAKAAFRLLVCARFKRKQT